MLSDFETITNYLHFTENFILIGSEVKKKIGIFVRYVISPFYPSFERMETHTSQWTRKSTLLLNGLSRCIYKTWMTCDIPYIQKSTILRDY